MKNTSSVRIGDRIKSARDEMGLSQSEFAEKMGYESATAISLIETGKRKVKTDALRKAARVLQRDVSYFLGQENQAPDIVVALRADKDLTEEDKKAVLHFVELAKRRHGK